MLSFLEGAAETTAQKSGGFGSSIIYIVMLVALGAVFYFFMYRPQKKQERETRSMLDSVKVGDEITTVGGIIGKVVSIKEETVLLETGRDKVRIRILKSSIRSIDVHAEDAE